MSMPDTLPLLEAAQQGDETACEQMLLANSGLIWSIVRRYNGRGIDSEELYQLGCMGFIKAIQGFDRNYGTQFSTYAVPKIAGEIRRFLRDDGTVKVGRRLREQARQIYLAREKLCTKLGREPLISELAEETGLTAEEIAQAEIAVSAPESLQYDLGDGLTLENMIGSDCPEEAMVEQLALQEAIETLPQREKLTIQLRFFHNMTQQQVAQILKVSQVQISRLERRALQKLRETLSE